MEETSRMMFDCLHILVCYGIAVAVDARAKKMTFDVEIVTMGYVQPTSPSSLLYTGPAFQTGIQQIKQEFQDVFNVSQVFLFDSKIKDCVELSTQCDDLAGRYFYTKRAASDMTVFIVPGCTDTVFTNRLVAQWNIPFLTSVYADPVIRKKSLSPTWVSTTPAAVTNFAVLYGGLFTRYNWTTVYFIPDDAANPFFMGLFKAVFAAFQSEKGNQGTFRLVDSAKDPNYTTVLHDFRRISRICLFFGHAKYMKILLSQAADANMVDGDYIYIGLDTFHNIKFGNFMWENYNATDNVPVPSQALSSMLLISLADSANVIKPGGIELEEVWNDLAKKNFNFSNPDNEKATPYTFSSHAIMEIFGQVLNESLTDDPKFDPSNGKKFASKFFQRRFQTTVSDVYIDRVGEPRVDLTLKQFDQRSGLLTIVAVQYSENVNLIDLKAIQWPNGRTPPLNRPQCGYVVHPTSCLSTSSYTITAVAAYCIALILAVCALALLFSWVYYQFYRKPQSYLWWKLDYSYFGLSRQLTSFRFDSRTSSLDSQGQMTRLIT